MSVYHVQRTPGAPAEGPVGIGRLVEELETGRLPADALVNLAGTDQWERAADALDYARREIASRPVHREERKASRVWARPLRSLSCSMVVAAVLLWLAAFFVFAGILSILVLALGVAVFVAAFLVDRKVPICGACGNRVMKTSAMCPTCRAQLR